MPVIYIHDENFKHHFTVQALGDWRNRLERFLREEAPNVLIVGDVAHALNEGSADQKNAIIAIKVDAQKCWISYMGKTECLSNHYDPRPKINEIKDHRRRLPPFVPGGGVRG